MKIIITESQYQRILEQEDWVIKAASGPQRCGRDAKEGGYGGSDCGSEKQVSRRKNKKNTESEYWVNQLMTPTTNTTDYQKRIDSIVPEMETTPGSFSQDQKGSIVYNLTNMLNNNKIWWFRDVVKNVARVNSDIFNDKNILDFIKSKGGFDKFKEYYLTEVMFS